MRQNKCINVFDVVPAGFKLKIQHELHFCRTVVFSVHRWVSNSPISSKWEHGYWELILWEMSRTPLCTSSPTGICCCSFVISLYYQHGEVNVLKIQVPFLLQHVDWNTQNNLKLHCILRLCFRSAERPAVYRSVLLVQELVNDKWSFCFLKTIQLFSTRFLCCQNVRKSVWSVRPAAPGGWRFTTETSGERCAMTTGAWPTPTWCVESWTVARRWSPKKAPSLARGRRRSGWMMCSAPEVKCPSWTVHTDP